ncbi:hypothetical protein ThrDRAFT_01950 [Frankia casuarinae]|uniref:Uncharacterized protein n=1 Tax=Frankia casuarinae (strain DSM 45818 / CECT 9043 / HFP020203 / CcI3) TaxID=106370 RepID=Q2JCL8_FRACC|nr:MULTISPECIES: hypothetical protein [Frankia]ABD10974.1 hypothetical protein Francci3_1598 [Frankia casuarinae]ETA02174.1 hypothetical protein CcI6DRAFT_02349 [Frankia sp. CcI6]EYT92340.1 hypothetical protein ThrDRAFT_01950 [Frankia casuarinae]KDA42857.1 hypothetical protein BMG523Draft_02246 [Frankia sp. BMG5.23]KEZ37508.1 hypothetical protein CEDDRAFT_01135 [Frankia sp. CeD]
MRDRRETDVVELAQEHAELLPERMTLAAIEINRTEFDPTFYPVGSPGSNNAQIDNHPEPQTAYSDGAFVKTIANSWNRIEQW